MNDSQKVPGHLRTDGVPEGFENVEPRDLAGVLLHRNYEAELTAIRILLFRHRQADKGLQDEIKSLEERPGFRSEQAVDRWLELLQFSTYQGAAHSMAAVGMLAPLVESIFDGAFKRAHEEFFLTENSIAKHPRWEWATQAQWDCHLVYDKNGKHTKDIVRGILQLSEAIGLAPHLPRDLKSMLEALFEYRNKMFHCGFEWPLEMRNKFVKRITDAGWPSNWFEMATSDGVPTIIYLTDVFVDICLKRIDRTIDGMGAFAAERLR